MKAKTRWSGLIGLVAMVALLVAACGGATPTPAAPLDRGDSGATMDEHPNTIPGDDSSMQQNDSGTMMQDDSGATMQDHPDTMQGNDASMQQSDSETMMQDDSGATMQDHPDTMQGNDASMQQSDSETMMQDDSGATMQDHPDSTQGDESNMQQNDSGTMMQDDSGATQDPAMTDMPGWLGAPLTDVRTGQDFRISDLKGKVVLVETMAIWCSNCLRQQKEVKALHQALGMNEDLVTVVLDIDPNEDADNLKAYADNNGFDWTYAVAPREVAREMGQLYGDQFLNPPSTPMLIVDRHGEVHPLPFGIKEAGTLEESLQPFLSAGM
jgi:thiol-disulfide isomerase/thioredoxin